MTHNPAARRKRHWATVAESIQRFEIEDELVETCSAHADPLGLACQVASELMRRYDAELPRTPNGAWVFPVLEEERTELDCARKLAPRSSEWNGEAKQVADHICKYLPADEGFLIAMAAARYFRVRLRP